MAQKGVTGDVAVDGECGERHKVGNSKAEGVVVPVGTFRVRGERSGLGTVDDGAGGEGGRDEEVGRDGAMG